MRYRNLYNTISYYSSKFSTDYQCYITMITKYFQTLITGLFYLNVLQYSSDKMRFPDRHFISRISYKILFPLLLGFL